MRILTWNLLLGTWLIVSCFALQQSAESIIITYAASVTVLAASIAALGKPAARYVVSVVAVAFAICAILLPDISWAARISDLITAALLFAVSLISPRRTRWDEKGEDTALVDPHGERASAPSRAG